MPQWQPNWEDVVFDHAAAEDAAAECESCARFLDARHEALGPSIEQARAEWRGAHRDRFDEDWAAIDRDADGLAFELLATARRIRDRSDEAWAEQRRREAERERWFEEKAREDAIEELRRQQAIADAAAQAAAQAAARAAADAAAAGAASDAAAAVVAVLG